MAIIGWISAVVFGIFFLVSLFKLCKSENTNDGEKNVYGVVKSTGLDVLYKKLSIMMIIVGIITAIGCVAGSYLDSYALAKYEYEKYNAEDRLDIAQSYLDKAEYYANKKNPTMNDAALYGSNIHEAERYISPGDSPMDYMIWNFHDVLDNLESVIPLSVIALLGILFPLYMLPAKIARKKAHEQTKVIVWLNGLLGCTVICWIAMIIWANSEKNSVQTIPQEATLTDKLDELKKLQKQGLLTEEEFEAKKKQILGI